MTFRLVAGWEQLPAGMTHVDVVDVAIDADDRVFVFCRGEHPVLVYEPDGTFAAAWGEGVFTQPHGLTFGPDGSLYATDVGDHTVRKLTPDGELLLTIGTPGEHSDTGAASSDPRALERSAGPFHAPTNAAVLRSGDIFVSDGYRNARVHRFSGDGEWLTSWGEPGTRPGEFALVHCVVAGPDGRSLYVADRENNRIQVFDLDGNALDELTGVSRPCGIDFDAAGRMYVAELGERVARAFSWLPPLTGASPISRCSVFDADLRLLGRWGTADATAPGSFAAAHSISVDSRGDVYVGEVTWSAGGSRGAFPADCHTLQKFTAR